MTNIFLLFLITISIEILILFLSRYLPNPFFFENFYRESLRFVYLYGFLYGFFHTFVHDGF